MDLIQIMSLRYIVWLSSLFAIIVQQSVLISAAEGAPFELKDGDRVVFLGDTFIEREQYYGWIELMLTTRFPDRNVTFRNLGWSADTPAGDSRFGQFNIKMSRWQRL